MLHEAVVAEGKALLLAAAAIEQNQVAGNVLDLLLRALLHALPGAGADVTDAWRLALFALVFRDLVQAVDRDIDGVVARVDDLDDLLHLVAVLHSHQAAEAPHTVVDMHHIVAHLELLQFLQRQRHLAAHRAFAAQVVFVVAVEYLVVGEEGHMQVVVAEAGVQGVVNRCELDACLLVVEDALQAVRLLLAVGQDIEVGPLVLKLLESIDEQVEVLVEYRLGMSVKLD